MNQVPRVLSHGIVTEMLDIQVNDNWTVKDAFPAGTHVAGFIEEGKKTVRFSRSR